MAPLKCQLVGTYTRTLKNKLTEQREQLDLQQYTQTEEGRGWGMMELGDG